MSELELELESESESQSVSQSVSQLGYAAAQRTNQKEELADRARIAKGV